MALKIKVMFSDDLYIVIAASSPLICHKQFRMKAALSV